jgi:hypothetical protein
MTRCLPFRHHWVWVKNAGMAHVIGSHWCMSAIYECEKCGKKVWR